MPQIIPTAEPFFLPGNETMPACLLIHGFTGTPKEMRWLGEYLNQQGYPALGIRLTGHATHPDEMIHSNYTDWLASVEDGFHYLSGINRPIYMIGLSMGGVLSLTAASYLPVKGVVAMSTPYALPDDWRLGFIDLIARFQPYMPKTKNDAPNAGWFDQESWKDHVSYPSNPTRSIGQIYKLLTVMRTSLPKVTVPTLLIHSRDDDYVRPDNMPSIYHDLGSTDKQMRWIEHSGHVITRDAQRETVFKAVTDFISRLEQVG